MSGRSPTNSVCSAVTPTRRSASSKMAGAGLRQPISTGQIGEERPVMRRELGGLGQLTTVRIEQALQQAGRAPIGIERETAEQVGEALGRRYLAVIDRTPALGLLPAFLQRLVKGLEREVGAPCAEDR